MAGMDSETGGDAGRIKPLSAVSEVGAVGPVE